MNIKIDTIRTQLVEQILGYIKDKLPSDQFKLIGEFAKYYYANIAVEDLTSHTIENLVGALLSHWQLSAQRKANELKVRVYNPEYEQDGWQSTHTIVELVYDDMPFIVDSITMEVNRLGFAVHLIINLGGIKIVRDDQGIIKKVLDFHSTEPKALPEATVYFEIDRQNDSAVLEDIRSNLVRVLGDVDAAVTDWQKMRAKINDAIVEIDQIKAPIDVTEINETKAFLQWLDNNNFTFMGYREYELIGLDDDQVLKIIPGSGLGVLRDDHLGSISRYYSELPTEARKLALSKQILIISKTNTKSTVHRPTYTDYIAVKRFDAEGKVKGERRFVGLYTSVAYNGDYKTIPIIRDKIDKVMHKANLPRAGHNAKALLHILETLPHEYLFELSVEELFDVSMGVLQLQGRRLTRLFIHQDVYKRYISCLLYMPRDNFNTELLYSIQGILQKSFNSTEVSFTTDFTESTSMRVHYIIRISSKDLPDYDSKTVEATVLAIARSWKDELQEEFVGHFGEAQGNMIFAKYARAFPAAYRENFSPRLAIRDVEHIEKLDGVRLLEMGFYRPLGTPESEIYLKLFRRDHTIPLSDALPMLENMGLRVMGEQPYQITLADGNIIWINDFHMQYAAGKALNIDEIREIFQEAFYNIWSGAAENDGFNRLVLAAQLNWREVTVLRAYAKFLRQADYTLSQPYIEQIFTNNANITRFLVQLFELRFNPALQKETVNEQINQVENVILNALDQVTSLDEDRTIRTYLNLINSTLRTNYFQKNADGSYKVYASFKLNAHNIPEFPLPRPAYAVFVYAPQFEGIHLRTSKVARGGIRWSDRREDFLAEILGLVKAQQVKNAIIVPSGAKGGFVVKQSLTDASREAIMEAGINCYKNFIRSLLDITDNYVKHALVPPPDTVRHDEDDPYLVVAADKGTATFSDTANSIAKEYGFWLGDAFASGGSVGYDHKKMGITARGAWVSVEQHFRELDINIHETDFTVVGIGDMAGDVFGNGMLLSKHIKLIGAFNHMHIFLDPNPDAAISFQERRRLFNLPRSTWADYDPKLLSQGGGVFLRSAKSIKLSPEIKAVLQTDKDVMPPNELIRALLMAPVDLLWNGGIGTYIKASTQNHAAAADRTNDGLRINANELRCRVVGEGGNLGVTQLGRIEYDLNGGRINTDFIDNSGGVDCSDHEVNIKILLDTVIARGDMTEKQRNEFLAKMTDEVGQLVLRDNYQQVRAISLATIQSAAYLNLYNRYLVENEGSGKINRALEFLPDDKTFIERKAAGKGLTRPEMAVLIAYSKIILKQKILDSDLPEDPYLHKYLLVEFPEQMNEKYDAYMQNHRLRRELIATQLSNAVVNDMGVTFVYQMQDETAAAVPVIIRAYSVAREIFHMSALWSEIESIDNKVSANIQLDMMMEVVRLIRRVTRWLLRYRHSYKDIADIAGRVEFFAKHIGTLFSSLPKLLVGSQAEQFEARRTQLMVEASVPETIATHIAAASAMYSALNIVEIAVSEGGDIEHVATVYFLLAEKLSLIWLRDYINAYPIDNRWSVLARSASKSDLDWQQRAITIHVLHHAVKNKTVDVQMLVDHWVEQHKTQVARWESIMTDIRSSAVIDFTMLAVAMRELSDLANSCQVIQGE